MKIRTLFSIFSSVWLAGSLALAADDLFLQRVEIHFPVNEVEGLVSEVYQTYAQRQAESQAYEVTLDEFVGVLLSPKSRNEPGVELAQVEFRQAWANLYVAKRLHECSRAYAEVIRGRNEWTDDEVPNSIKSLLSSRAGLYSKMLREVGWVNEILDVYVPLAKRFREQPIQMDLPWLDPSGLLREDITRQCEYISKALFAYETDRNFSAWRETLRYTFDRSDQTEEDHVEKQALEYIVGLKEGTSFALKDLPTSFYYGVKGRLQTIQGWITGDELTYELTRQTYADRARRVQEFAADPDGRIVEETEKMGEMVLTLSSRDIGAITAGVEVALVTEKGLRLFAGSSLARRPVSLSGQRMSAEIAMLERKLIMDPLSRVYNKGALFAERAKLGAIGTRIQNMISKGKKVSALYLDGDFFKAFNDLLSHSAGDDLIRTFADEARKVAASLREGDLVFRMGGEEFLIILPETSLDEAVQAARRLQENIRKSQMRVRLNERVRQKSIELEGRRAVDPHASETLEGAFRGIGQYPESGNVGTVSIGVAEVKAGEGLEGLINAADEALKAAKANPGKQGVAMRITTDGQDTHVLVNGKK